MMRNKPGRPSGATRRAPADRYDRPVKAYKPSRRTAEEYAYPDGEEFYEARPARVRTSASRSAKARGAALPFGDDGYQTSRAKGAARIDPYGERPARKSGRPARMADEEYPVRAARGYGEELPVRGKTRAHLPRPVERYRPDWDDFEEFDRPIRRTAGARRSRKKPAGGAFLYWAVAIVLALLIGFGVRTFGFELITVRGDAMRGTLAEGEIALVKKTVYYTQKPARGDIVAVNSPQGKLIRRVVALPGEIIEIKGGVTYVNDEPLDEPYVYQMGEGDYPRTTIQEGCYFVMCDNRLNIDDSRTFNLVKNTRSLIVGKVDFIVWPLTDWGPVETR